MARARVQSRQAEQLLVHEDEPQHEEARKLWTKVGTLLRKAGVLLIPATRRLRIRLQTTLYVLRKVLKGLTSGID
jgi:hypothetical protein